MPDAEPSTSLMSIYSLDRRRNYPVASMGLPNARWSLTTRSPRVTNREL
jgi:hypothetical protein